MKIKRFSELLETDDLKWHISSDSPEFDEDKLKKFIKLSKGYNLTLKKKNDGYDVTGYSLDLAIVIGKLFGWKDWSRPTVLAKKLEQK